MYTQTQGRQAERGKERKRHRETHKDREAKEHIEGRGLHCDAEKIHRAILTQSIRYKKVEDQQ